MRLSHMTTIKINNEYSNIIGHMGYAAYKLWNVCNYERNNYKELDLPVDYPDWYYQKKAHKDDIWFKSLPSQSAQEICKQLDKSWKSFYKLIKTGGIENPQPPRYKHDKMVFSYLKDAIVHETGSDQVRLTISKQLQEFMKSEYDICETYLFLENEIFKKADNIKQIKIYPPEDNECKIIVIYEIDDVEALSDNQRYLSIDIGLHNLMTCFNSTNGESFIAGRKYLSICHYYEKEIAKVQSQWYEIQATQGSTHYKSSKHIKKLYERKNNTIKDYLHKTTRAIVEYCKEQNINTLVIGDITNIRKDKNLGHETNMKLHALPYKRIYELLQYKCEKEGINFRLQKEAYTSQCSPKAKSVTKKRATKSKRVERGLYKDGEDEWNADVVGAYNILRLYLKKNHKEIKMSPDMIQDPTILKVAV